VADQQRHKVCELGVADEHALEELDDDRGDEEAEEEDEQPAEAVADDVLDALLAVPAEFWCGGCGGAGGSGRRRVGAAAAGGR
jgi:hypothetical protein